MFIFMLCFWFEDFLNDKRKVKSLEESNKFFWFFFIMLELNIFF